MFCTYCGEKVPNEREPCPACGRKSPLIPEGAPSRQGNVMYVPTGVQLPPFCIKCNAPAEGEPKRVKLTWHPPALLFLILLGLLPYAIVAMICSKKAVVYLPLCAKHRSPWTITSTIGLLLLLGGVGVCGVLIWLDASNTSGPGIIDRMGPACLLIPLAAIAGVVVMVFSLRRVAPSRIDDFGNAWIKGINGDYLNERVGPSI